MPRKIKSFSQESGFSIIELSIVLVIIGIIASMGIPCLLEGMRVSKRTQTQEKQKQILTVLANYVLNHQKLPCPGDPGDHSAHFGEARLQCTSPQQAIGIIPFKTLGLSENYAKDAYQHYFTYAMEGGVAVEHDQGIDFLPFSLSQEAKPISSQQFFCSINSPLEIHVREVTSRGTVIEFKPNSKNKKQNIAVVLVSHGESGYGCFLDNGQRKQALSLIGEEKKINAEESMKFIKHPFSSDPKNYFDDHVEFATRQNLLVIYAGKTCESISSLQSLGRG
jgi:prepilin-type N-terminal cleavage/methylation domain-containing protein